MAKADRADTASYPLSIKGSAAGKKTVQVSTFMSSVWRAVSICEFVRTAGDRLPWPLTVYQDMAVAESARSHRSTDGLCQATVLSLANVIAPSPTDCTPSGFWRIFWHRADHTVNCHRANNSGQPSRIGLPSALVAPGLGRP